jgi:hypothetical protein
MVRVSVIRYGDTWKPVTPPPALQPLVGQGLLNVEASRSHCDTHSVTYYYSGRMINPKQRPLLHNTHYSQETDIHASGGIRTHNPKKRVTADPRLHPRGHWDRKSVNLLKRFKLISVSRVCHLSALQ